MAKEKETTENEEEQETNENTKKRFKKKGIIIEMDTDVATSINSTTLNTSKPREIVNSAPPSTHFGKT